MADLLKKLNLNGTEYELGMSSAERVKLEGIAEGAQVNVLEGVQVDGTDLSISGKKVNIDLANPIKDAVDAAKSELSGRIQTIENSYETKDNVATAKSEAISASAVTISESEGSGDILKTYTFSQNGSEIGKINLAKDLVVSGGEIIEKEGVKYLSLTIANKENTTVEIPVSDLVDVYTGSTYIDINSSNEVSVKFAELATALAAEGNAVGNKMKANAEAAAAAQSAAEGAQGTADGIRSDLGNKNDEANSTGSAFARIAKVAADLNSLSGGAGSVSDQIDAKLSAYDTATVQPLSGKVTANENKLKGISEGANKVTMSVENDILKVVIA